MGAIFDACVGLCVVEGNKSIARSSLSSVLEPGDFVRHIRVRRASIFANANAIATTTIITTKMVIFSGGGGGGGVV